MTLKQSTKSVTFNDRLFRQLWTETRLNLSIITFEWYHERTGKVSSILRSRLLNVPKTSLYGQLFKQYYWGGKLKRPSHASIILLNIMPITFVHSTRTVDFYNIFVMSGWQYVILIALALTLKNTKSVGQVHFGKSFESWTWELLRELIELPKLFVNGWTIISECSCISFTTNKKVTYSVEGHCAIYSLHVQ